MREQISSAERTEAPLRWVAPIKPLAILLAAAAALCCPAAASGAVRVAPPRAEVAVDELPRLGWVGRVRGTRAFVGIVARRNEVTAYVCDGRKLARWFRGRLRARTSVLRDGAGARLNVRLGVRARGVLRIRGRAARRFVARRARGRAGLFRSVRTVGRARRLSGWVRLNGGAVRGASAIADVRVERRGGVDVALLEKAVIGRPPGPPKLDQRVASTVARLCDAFTGKIVDGKAVPLALRGCGLPLAGLRPPASGARVVSRPDGFKLSPEALSALAKGIGARMRRERARLFELAKESEPGPSSAVGAAAREAAARMLRDTRLLDAANRVRRAARGSAVAAAIEAYRLQVQPYLQNIGNLLVDSELLRLRLPGTAHRERPFRVVQAFLGPWAEVAAVDATGDDWEISDELQLSQFAVHGEATSVTAHARAGFDSSVEFTKLALLGFDVPPNAGEVEIEFDTSATSEAAFDNCFGIATGSFTDFEVVFDVGDDGTVDPLNDPTVAGGFDLHLELDMEAEHSACGFPTDAPIPPPPSFETVPTVYRFNAPPQGGSYVAGVGVIVEPRVFLGGTAMVEADVAVQEVVVRHDG